MTEPDLRQRFIKPSMDPQKLQHFLSVYDTGSFSRAASNNDVSQQAVSKSVAKLEETLSVRLFERGAFGAEPTQFGHALARRAKVITAESRLAAAEISAMRGADRGYVRIGLGWSFLTRIAPMVINRFSEKQPGVTLSITSGDTKTLYEKLLRGEVEFVASAPPSDLEIDNAIDTTEMFEDRDVIMMRRDHPLASKTDITLEDLSSQTWLVSMQLQMQWQRICNVFLAAGLSPPAKYVDMDSVILAKSTLLQSDAVMLLAKELIATEEERAQYHIIEGTEFPVARTAYFAIRRNSLLQPAAQSLKNELVAACRSIVGINQLHGMTVAERP
ncbi:LysR family transcriptional regulator [Sphingorhabdus sp. EL138]|uniref:LysR family transcriptional regulator n=1 Tax=Sphingorhabdus sp. EL138 TaxID=2073156 RepID=UPI000D68B72D|nr:LysR family transcriptional regulator [Sphingorhabdus sp. EL138]